VKKPKPRQKSERSVVDTRLFERLFKVARSYLERAHSPYSLVQVASAVLMDNGEIYGGCNIENASYGGTICAERVAITKAISEGAKKISTILVVTNQKEIWPPCGLCRQVIAEFSTPHTVVCCTDLNKKSIVTPFQELFPGAFDGSFLK
jgi:cytidine deaminase